MRVCMMNDSFYRSSGAAIAVRRMSEAMTGVDYYVALCPYDGRTEDLSWVSAERVGRFDFKTSKPLHALRELFRFKKWFRQQGCDLVHCHHRRISALIQLLGIPVLYTGHLAFPYSIWFRWLHPRRMIAVTPSVAANFLETTGRPALGSISNPVHFPDCVPEIDLPGVKNRAVCIARLEPIKGHKHLLDAWKILVDRGHQYELNLVGEGSLKPQLEAQAERDGLQKLVHFRGFSKNVSKIIGESSFAILASEVEGQGMVTLEAAAMGRASLLTAVPGSIDLIPPDHKLKNGVAFGDKIALADALEEWFSRPEEAVKEGERFFNFLKASSDPKRIANQYREIYRQIIAGEV